MTKLIRILITMMLFWSAATMTSVYAFDLKLSIDSRQIASNASEARISAIEEWRANAR